MRLNDMRSSWLKSFFNFLLLLINEKSWNLKTVVAAPEMLSNPKSFIEHQITEQEAKQAIKNIESISKHEAGCKECNRAEMKYCLSTDVLSDHCCCDRKYHETFPYMEHVCPFEETSCQPIARDCSEYRSIVECCCHQYLAEKWKTNYSKSQAKSIHHNTLELCSFCVLTNALMILLMLTKYMAKIS